MRSIAAIAAYAVLVYWTWEWIKMEGDWWGPVAFTGSLFILVMYALLAANRR